MRYFWKPASVKISAKLITIVAVTRTPKDSGVNNLAKTMVVIGDISLTAISVTDDHFVAFTIFWVFGTDIKLMYLHKVHAFSKYLIRKTRLSIFI